MHIYVIFRIFSNFYTYVQEFAHNLCIMYV